MPSHFPIPDRSPAVQVNITNLIDDVQYDLTDTIFAGHHQPLKVWVLCLYFMGLNVSNEQIAHELALHGSDVQQMTTQLREGIVKKSHQWPCQGRWSATKPM